MRVIGRHAGHRPAGGFYLSNRCGDFEAELSEQAESRYAQGTPLETRVASSAAANDRADDVAFR
jgi:hypothetical protein